MLQRMCDFALATGGYSLAWVGRAEADKSVRPIARSGNIDALDRFPVRLGRLGPRARTERNGDPHRNRHDRPRGDSRLAPWAEHLGMHPDRAIIAFPLRDDDGVFGSDTCL